jgi:prolyl-tRNA synthetase
MGLDRSEAVAVMQQLAQAGVDAILDDRSERPGVMFADWELIGVPLRLTVGDRGLKEGLVELTVRRGLATEKIPLDGAARAVVERLTGL